MKILFGIQGTGNGHISRSTQVIDCLNRRGAAVDVCLSGCGKDKVYDRRVFRPMNHFKGFTFRFHDGKINVPDTVRQLPVLEFAKDVLTLDTRSYDLVVTDFEPVTAMAARVSRVPSIGIGHQYAFLYDIPIIKTHPADRLIMNYFAPADHPLGFHWHHFNQPIVPPVIPSHVRPMGKIDPQLILVYLPFETRERIRDLVSGLPDFKFSVYGGDNRNRLEADGNILWHPFSKTTFFQDLALCSGVICNAGFELPSEALFLGKKLLVKPLKGQFEQGSNALALERLRLGSAMKELDRARVENWLARDRGRIRNYPDVADIIAQWIMEGDWDDMQTLVRKTWDRVTGNIIPKGLI